MTRFLQIPLELQEQCLSYLLGECNALLSACLVSHHMRLLVFPFLYRRLCMDSSSVNALSHRIIAEKDTNVSSLDGLKILNFVSILVVADVSLQIKGAEPDLYLAAKAVSYLHRVDHLEWVERIYETTDPILKDISYLIQSIRESFPNLHTMRMYLATSPRETEYIASDTLRLLFTFPRLKDFRIFSLTTGTAYPANCAMLDPGIYLEPYLFTLERSALTLQVLEFSASFYTEPGGSMDNPIFTHLYANDIHFPSLQELHIRAPFEEEIGSGETDLIRFIKQHALHLKALSLPCPSFWGNFMDPDHSYENTAFPSLPALKKLDVSCYALSIMMDQDVIPNIEEVKVWLGPTRRAERDFDPTPEEFHAILLQLGHLKSLTALDLCQSSIEFDAGLVTQLANACPKLEWVAFLVQGDWASFISALSQMDCLRTFRTPDIPYIGPEANDAVRSLAIACSSLSRIEWVTGYGTSVNEGCILLCGFWIVVWRYPLHEEIDLVFTKTNTTEALDIWVQ